MKAWADHRDEASEESVTDFCDRTEVTQVDVRCRKEQAEKVATGFGPSPATLPSEERAPVDEASDGRNHQSQTAF